MKIIVDKSVIPQLLDLGIRFTIVEDKPVKEVPEEWSNALIKVFERWNNQKRIAGKKGLPTTRKILPTHIDVWNKLYSTLRMKEPKEGFEMVTTALKNYIEDIAKREEGGYGDHRFTLYEFLSQKNGLRKFLAK